MSYMTIMVKEHKKKIDSGINNSSFESPSDGFTTVKYFDISFWILAAIFNFLGIITEHSWQTYRYVIQ